MDVKQVISLMGEQFSMCIFVHRLRIFLASRIQPIIHPNLCYRVQSQLVRGSTRFRKPVSGLSLAFTTSQHPNIFWPEGGVVLTKFRNSAFTQCQRTPLRSSQAASVVSFEILSCTYSTLDTTLESVVSLIQRQAYFRYDNSSQVFNL